MLLRGLALIVGFVAGINLALGVPGIMRRLHPNPDAGAGAAELAEPRRHLRRDLRALRQDLLQLGKRDSKRRGRTWLEEIERYARKAPQRAGDGTGQRYA
ncbi:MAG TPA: hypothetical protein VNZ53_02660 [Steroidobacteraceae bacterium]|jgi:hypothetical protein|nr:hypothetical protein [Steroidobacteraceae bacterium]